jgi:hypothetical protein
VTCYLLDVNVLIALIDPTHVQHDRAHHWFSARGKKAWATCPLTENGVLRIFGNSRYLNSPGNARGRGGDSFSTEQFERPSFLAGRRYPSRHSAHRCDRLLDFPR